MTHQRGGRPGSSGRGATGGGASDVGSRNWEIAHGTDVGNNGGGSDNELINNEGDYPFPVEPSLWELSNNLSKEQLCDAILTAYNKLSLGASLMLMRVIREAQDAFKSEPEEER